MASNLDYLDPALLPLEEMVQAYLKAEKQMAQAEITATTIAHAPAAPTQPFEQRPPTGSYAQEEDEAQQNVENLRNDLARLRQQIIEQLPVRDEWVKVNLGYGPSRVGAFRVENASDAAPGGYELRVVF
ncbi:hypothetical protein ACFPAF_01665 [Hymenobacter endophyticus]|uniref:Uncharacterized protein n=1 Tax=Hymenobacter endophyticus TaxID=3076335 RepID=A0ABU3TCJ1_9BACT|nr:hypothetical protein [Hymenobacter endophyticus]MDU0369085.1 hypothetical protein [Hymenobacter endophyticus]